MSDVKHTPGPWVYRPHQFDDWGYVRAQKHNDGFYSFICQAKDPRVTEDDENAARKNMVDPWEANARLIAAAPELLEALVDAFNAFEFEQDRQDFLGRELCERIPAIIAKAKGKT